MPIEIIEGSAEDAPKIYDCGWRAFADDLLQNTVFSIAEDDLDGRRKLREFRLSRLSRRLQGLGCRVFLAIDKMVDNGSRILGYAVWYEQAVFESIDGDKQDMVEDKPDVPKFINVEMVKRVENLLEETRQEYLKDINGKIWYLGMLGVDPDFAGRGIASELVKHGAEQARRANLPAYTESTPAAVRVYTKQGFKTLGRKDLLEEGAYYFTAMLKMPDDSSS